MFKLVQCAEQNRRKLGSFAYLAKVVEVGRSINGGEVETQPRPPPDVMGIHQT